MIAFFVLAAVAYAWAKGDPGGSWSSTRAAGGAGVRTGAGSAKATWNRRRPDRAKKREDRRTRWTRAGLWGWAAVGAERLLIGTARLGWDTTCTAARFGWDGGKAAREEWRTTWKTHHPEPGPDRPDQEPEEGGPAGGPPGGPDHPGRCSWTVSPPDLAALGVQKSCGRPATHGPFCAKHAEESRRTECVRGGHVLGSDPACPECGSLRGPYGPDPTGGRVPIREPNGGRPWWAPTPAPVPEPTLVGAGTPTGGAALGAAVAAGANPRIDHTPPANPPVIPAEQRCAWCNEQPATTTRGKLPVCATCGAEIDARTSRIVHNPDGSVSPAAPTTQTPGPGPDAGPDADGTPAPEASTTPNPFTHGGPPGMSTGTIDTAQSSLTGIRKWCADAISEITEGTTGALVGQASHLYEGFDGAIARIEGQVGEAATAAQEAAAAVKEALAALAEAIQHLDQTAAAAIGD